MHCESNFTKFDVKCYVKLNVKFSESVGCMQYHTVHSAKECVTVVSDAVVLC